MQDAWGAGLGLGDMGHAWGGGIGLGVDTNIIRILADKDFFDYVS